MNKSGHSFKYEAKSLRVQELPRAQQPRELVERQGPENVQDEVLLAVLLRTGLPNRNVLDLARDLLHHYGSLTEMAKASVDELTRHRGLGQVKAQILKCSLELARRLAKETVNRVTVRSPEEVVRVLGAEARGLDVEYFWILLLDQKYRLIRPPHVVSKGILDASLVHPREVFKEAVRTGCAAVILAHNHPSGDSTPSAEDIRITRKLVEAGRLMEMDVLDHVVLGQQISKTDKPYTSLRESNLVEFE